MSAATVAPAPAPPPDRDGEQSVMPRVTRPRRGLSGLAIAIIAVVLGAILFAALDARRRAYLAPAVSPQALSSARMPGAPPPLDIPPPPEPIEPVVIEPVSPPPPAAMSYPRQPPQPVQQYPSPPQQVYAPPPEPVRASSGPAVVFDSSANSPADSPTAIGNSKATTDNTARARAAMISNRATTVAQGTMIRGVLETALDSTHPGFARAIVSRDVMGFDGTRVLIPRGSRLIGDYSSDVAQGQKRALINWTRLIRPDGATIAIGSPATDPVGRGGVKADVDGHFWQRFSSSILQSVLDLGVNLASRKAGGTVIYSLPGSTVSGVGEPSASDRIVPTLKVKPGASISIFVARDLDFSSVETRR